MKPAIELVNIDVQTGSGFPEPFASRLGPYQGRDLTGHFDLKKFGASVETLPPGSQSALRHWHSESDELVVVLQGELTLVTNQGPVRLTAHMCAGFNGGEANGHHLINESTADAMFLVIGSRSSGDVVAYPDDDLQWMQDEAGAWAPHHKDGTAYP